MALLDGEVTRFRMGSDGGSVAEVSMAGIEIRARGERTLGILVSLRDAMAAEAARAPDPVSRIVWGAWVWALGLLIVAAGAAIGVSHLITICPPAGASAPRLGWRWDRGQSSGGRRLPQG